MKTDARYQQSDARIQNEFLKLVKTVGFDHITVSQIVKAAEINRSTFYAHYIDKEDLMEKMQLATIEEVLSNLPKLSYENLQNASVIRQRIIGLCEGLYQRRDIFQLFIGPKSDGKFGFRLTNRAQKEFQNNQLDQRITIPAEYVNAMTGSTVINLMVTWMQREFKETPEEFSEIVGQVAPGIFKNLLNV